MVTTFADTSQAALDILMSVWNLFQFPLVMFNNHSLLDFALFILTFSFIMGFIHRMVDIKEMGMRRDAYSTGELTDIEYEAYDSFYNPEPIQRTLGETENWNRTETNRSSWAGVEITDYDNID